jgi:hypothetical protein
MVPHGQGGNVHCRGSSGDTIVLFSQKTEVNGVFPGQLTHYADETLHTNAPIQPMHRCRRTNHLARSLVEADRVPERLSRSKPSQHNQSNHHQPGD